nr:hypothetical protein [Tanacetum cinerariifolium]
SPILVKDSDSLMEEIDLSCTPDYPMPLGIKDDDYDSERDILILKDLPSNNTLSFAEKESFHFDIPSFSRPPAKPPYSNTEILNIKMMEYEASYDDQSFSDEDVSEKIFLKPLFEEEIIHRKMDQHYYNAESDLMESLRTYDSSLLISSKIDSLLDEFAGELILLKSIPPGIDETDCDF